MTDMAKGFGNALKNPLVIGGGLLLGVVLLMGGRNSTAANNTPSPGTAALGGVNSVAEINNRAALQMQSDNLAIWAGLTAKQLAAEADITTATIGANRDVAIANIGANVQRDTRLLSYLDSVGANMAIVGRQAQVSRQGITQEAIRSSSAAAIDSAQNMARIALANVNAPKEIAIAREQGRTAREVASINGTTARYVAEVNANASVQAARYQYKAIKKASNNSLIKSLAGDALGLVKAAAF